MGRNRFRYLHVLQGDYGYGHGWEDISQSEDRAEMVDDRTAYRVNAPQYAYRIVRRREPADTTEDCQGGLDNTGTVG